MQQTSVKINFQTQKLQPTITVVTTSVHQTLLVLTKQNSKLGTYAAIKQQTKEELAFLNKYAKVIKLNVLRHCLGRRYFYYNK